MFDLTDEQRRIQALAREFAEKEIVPIARDMDERRYFPRDLVRKMAPLGFLAGPIPSAYGGHGLDYLSFALVYEEIGRACSSVRGFLAVHVGLCALCIYDWGTEAQKREFLPRLTAGEAIGAYALTEENAGSDVASMETTAGDAGDHYVVNGEKIWITNGTMADVIVVFAQADRALKHKGIVSFIVTPDLPGLGRATMEGKELGHCASDHARLTFRDLRVPKSRLLGGPGDGFAVAMSALDHGRLGVAAGAVGVAQACLDACLEFAATRVQFGKPIGEFQMIQQVLADMATETDAARLLVYRAAVQKMRGLKNTRETSMAKLFATEAAMRAANQAVLLHGNRGYTNRYPVERYLRDIKGYEIYEGTSHIQRVIIARALLKERGAVHGGGTP